MWKWRGRGVEGEGWKLRSGGGETSLPAEHCNERRCVSIDIYHSGKREVLSVTEQDFNYLTFW